MSTHTTSNVVDQAADSAHTAIRATQDAANGALDRLSNRVDTIRDTASPKLDRWSAQAEAAARRSVEALRDTSQHVRESALRASDATIGYVKDEPVKSMLIAAATGAALMGLLTLMMRSRRD
ncbi:MAG: hypothetical protein JSR59_22020 [Proteobacteria bacterium]|nr:hypothetical protein [Pseudomonadota bacterium]